ncbi:STAS domain-containing protein [Pseudoneobacillus sp. C159]
MNMTMGVRETEREIYVSVSGEIDVYTAPKLKETLFPLSEKSRSLIVDFSGVTYMDSTGLGVMVGVFKSVKIHHGTFKLTGLSDRLYRLFTITGLAEIMDINREVEGEML